MVNEIGKIVEVKGVLVKAELYDLLPPYIVEKNFIRVAPRINSFVKTKVGLNTVICQITGEYYDEQRKGQFTGYYLDLAVKGYFDNGSFIQGMRMLPMVSATIEVLDIDEFKMINDNKGSKSFSIGTSLFDDTQKYFFDYNEIMPSHVGVFGNTGSGKSNTLAKLVSNYAYAIEKSNNVKILVIDINNEYGNNAICDLEQKTVYNLTTRTDSIKKMPLDYSKLQEDDWCVLLGATEATQRPVIKTAFSDKREEQEYENLIKEMIKTGQNQLIKSIKFNLREYVEGLQNLYWHTTSEVFYFLKDGKQVYVNSFGTEIEKSFDDIKVKVPEERLPYFLFKLYFAVAIHIGYGTQYEFVSPMLRRAEKLISDFEKVFCDEKADIFEDKNIAIIQLANVNKDMMELIPSIIVNQLFREQIQKKGEGSVSDIVNVVVDEAHNLLYDNESDVKHQKITIEIFERAIKEGRKFGMFLLVSSQRPSDISPTIVSQMHNYFIHKLVNPNDLSRIRKAVAFMDQSAMDSLTVLGPGECIVSGTAIKMPCFIKVEQLKESNRPNSENVVLFGDGGILEDFMLRKND